MRSRHHNRIACFFRLWRCLPPRALIADFHACRTSIPFCTLSILISNAVLGATPDPRNTDWALLGNSSDAQHQSNLSQINRKTVSQLGLAWSADIDSQDGLVGNPLVKNGIVFQSGARGRIFSNDVRTGAKRWTFTPPYRYPNNLVGDWASRYNRGLALTDDLAVVGTGNCELIAVEQMTGKKRWEVSACEPSQLQGITGAPRVGGGMVFIGNMCGDSGASRGHVDAFDEKTGRHLWRFYTVPGDPSKPQDSPLYDMAAKTWGTGWYDKTHGCGSPWDAMLYDPKLDLLYIGTGGPAPFPPNARAPDAGDELFTNAIVALKAKTGEYVWHFSETPHDGWNYEAAVGIMVADLPLGGQQRHVVISVPKNGFLYVLDAASGKYLSGAAYGPITWASGLDEQGRPKRLKAGNYWEQPSGSAVLLPSNMGAHGWEALAYSPSDHILYIPVQVLPTRMTVLRGADVGGLSMDFYASRTVDGETTHGEIVAWDPVSQTARWRVRHATAVNGGLMLSGGLVFEGTADGHFSAFDSDSGARLWSVQLDGVVRAAPSTVMVNGEQYILVASGNANSSGTSSYVAQQAVLPSVRGNSRLLAFKLGGTASLPPPRLPPPMPKPPSPRFDQELVGRGRTLFEQEGCVDCHGLRAESAGGAAPDLRYVTAIGVQGMRSIVVDGVLSSSGMPQFENLSSDDISALYAYVVHEAWNAYDAEHSGPEAKRRHPAGSP